MGKDSAIATWKMPMSYEKERKPTRQGATVGIPGSPAMERETTRSRSMWSHGREME